MQMAASVEINMSAVKSTQMKPIMLPAADNDNTAPTPKSGNITPRQQVSKSNTSNNSSSTTSVTPAPLSPTKTASSQPQQQKKKQQQKQQPVSPSSYTATPSIRKHEEFKNQLVHDVFERDNKGRVPMEKVAMLIWQFRDDPAVVQFMAQFVAKVRFVCVCV